MKQIKKKAINKAPSSKPRAWKKRFILVLCLPLAILVCTSPLNACAVPDISDGYAASRVPNQLAGNLQDLPAQTLLARGGGRGGGRGQGKGGGSGSGQCDGSGSGQGQGQGQGRGYGAQDGTGTGERPQDGTGYGAGSGRGNRGGSGGGGNQDGQDKQ